MKKIFLFISLIFIAASCSYSVKFSGENIPYDSTFRLGLVNGPGTGVSIGADVFFPLEGINLGADIEQQVTNSEFEQNLNILKYALALKYDINNDLYLSVYFGRASFYITKTLDYTDSYSGGEYTIDEDTRGSATFWAISPHFKVGEYYLSPRIVANSIVEGGNILEVDINIEHKF